MPNRIVRESILTSDKVDSLDAAAEVFYRRLMSKVDDHGLYDARPCVLRASLFPLRLDKVREADCSRWMAACQKAGLIALYSHGGKPYLKLLNTQWAARSEPKYPQPQTLANNCAQLQTSARLDGDVVVDVVEDVSVVVGAPARPKREKKIEQTLADWVMSLPDDEEIISDSDSIYDWATKLGLPRTWIHLAWFAFEGKYGENGKVYADWRAVFRKALREDWLKLWRTARSGGWELTTAGQMAEREMSA